MKYLKKQWYELCQQTGYHFGMRVHKEAGVYDESLYLRLYKRKEKEYIRTQQEVYDCDPRFFLELDHSTFVRLDALVKGDGIGEEDKMVYQLSLEQKDHIQQLIKEFDARPPFDKKKCKAEFYINQESIQNEVTKRLPHELFLEIADLRVFALGYCTKDVKQKLKNLSKENKKEINRILSEYIKVKDTEQIPESIKNSFGFHDCEVTALTTEKNVTMKFDTDREKITFIEAQIERMDEGIIGSTWLYEELYAIETGYEAHMLFYTDKGTIELIIRCKDILIEN